jgi:hypothetical protein
LPWPPGPATRRTPDQSSCSHHSSSWSSSGRARNGAVAASARSSSAGDTGVLTFSPSPAGSTASTTAVRPVCSATSSTNSSSEMTAVMGMVIRRRLSNPAGSWVTTPTTRSSASRAAPDIPAHPEPPAPAAAGGLVISTAYNPALISAPGLSTPTAWWLSRRCGVATTAGNPIAAHARPARVVTSRPHRTGCRHLGSTQPGSVISTSAASTPSSSKRCHTARALTSPPDCARTRTVGNRSPAGHTTCATVSTNRPASKNPDPQVHRPRSGG